MRLDLPGERTGVNLRILRLSSLDKGHDLRGELGTGGPHIRLSDVNGRIQIHHASDGRALSPAKDLSHRDDDEDDSKI